MKKTILLLVVLVAAALATAPAILSNASQPLATQELLWDDDSYDSTIGDHDRGVWFVMPFDGQVVTARVYIAPDAADPGASFTFLLCPRDGSGMPDDGNPYGSGSITGSGGTADGWFDVDVTSLGVNLNNGDEFYLCFYDDTNGEPSVAHDGTSASTHNAWNGGSGWSTSGLPAYMFRVIVDDAGSQVELTTWGTIKALDN